VRVRSASSAAHQSGPEGSTPLVGSTPG